MSIDVTSCPPNPDEGPVATTLQRQASGVKAIPAIKRRVWAAAATITIVCALGAAVTGAASAASQQCGDKCISVFSVELGSHDQLNFVEAVLGDGRARIGQPVGLKPANKLDPTQDLMPDAPSRTPRWLTYAVLDADGGRAGQLSRDCHAVRASLSIG